MQSNDRIRDWISSRPVNTTNTYKIGDKVRQPVYSITGNLKSRHAGDYEECETQTTGEIVAQKSSNIYSVKFDLSGQIEDIDAKYLFPDTEDSE